MGLIVFDLDHTLLKGNSSYFFGWYLYRQKVFTFWTFLNSLGDYIRHKWCGLSLHALHNKVFASIFQGSCRDEIESYADCFLKESLPHLLSQPLLKILKEGQARGDTVLLLSSSPEFLVKKVAEILGIERWGGTTYFVDDKGKFTSISHIMEGGDKARYVSLLAKNLSIPLSAVSVYSDSHLDLPLFNLAGRAICVDPDRQLKKICKQNGWDMIHGA